MTIEPEIAQIIELIIGVIAAAIAWWENRQKVRARAETAQVVAFFDPNADRGEEAPAGVPARSYTMSNETKRWLTFDHSPQEEESLLRQVAEAEMKGRTTYTISVPTAWYEIEYGLIKSSGRKVA